MNWNEILIVGVLVLCVFGPVAVVLLTQDLLDSADDVASEHFDFDGLGGPRGGKPPTGDLAGAEPPAGHHDR